MMYYDASPGAFFIDFLDEKDTIKGTIFCPFFTPCEPENNKTVIRSDSHRNEYYKAFQISPKGQLPNLWPSDMIITKSTTESWDMKLYTVMTQESGSFWRTCNKFTRNKVFTDPNVELKLTDDGVFLFRKNPFYHCFQACLWSEDPQIFPYAGELAGQQFDDQADEKSLSEKTMMMFWKIDNVSHCMVLCAESKKKLRRLILDVYCWRKEKVTN